MVRVEEVTNHDGLDGNDGAETKADAFARDLLIPPEAWAAFVATRPRSRAAVLQLTERLGIAPGIVVGRLQHQGLLPHRTLNDLKVSLRWVARE